VTQSAYLYCYYSSDSLTITLTISLLIHNLRLGYLRNVVEDPYGPRLISFNPSFPTNPYITAASLADLTKWPELGMPPSPPISPSDSDGSGSGPGGPASPGGGGGAASPRSISGFPGATGLKYTSTILGPSRTGAIGMGVSGRRRHDVSKPSQGSSIATANSAQDREQSEYDTMGTAVSTPATAKPLIMSKSPPRALQQEQQHATAIPDAPPPPPLKPVFVPKFKGAAEMDERRRLRLQARRGAAAAGSASGGVTAPEIIVVTSSDRERGAVVDVMSSGEEAGDEVEEEEEDSFSQVEDEDFDVVDVGVSVDIDGDEFDPCVFTLFNSYSVHIRANALPASLPLRV
jgi:target of rapamycin complex 2 subunit MAPKAP1